MKIRITLTMIFLMLPPLLSSAAIIRVPADQPNIQAGIDAAVNGDTVLVGEGTWTGPGNRLINFNGKEITVRSEHGRDRCLIDLDGQGPAFYLVNGEGRDAKIQGFTIWYGHSSLAGGALHCGGASPTITGCRFSMNESDAGGGAIHFFGGAPIIEFCQFSNNSATGEGGAINCRGNAYIAARWCRFQSNSADEGGAVCAKDGSSITISNSVMTGNGAISHCGAVHCEDNGSSVSLRNCVVTENTSAMYTGGVGILRGAHGSLDNCLITENVADWHTGGIHVGGSDPDPSTLQMAFTTIANNQAVYAGGMGCGGGNVTINSCIVYGNVADTGSQFNVTSGNFDVRYSCVQGGWSGTGNINAVPWFTEGPFGHYYLSHRSAGQAFDSPCIDAGDPSWNPYPSTTSTQGEWDTVRVDMGYHRLPGRIVAGPGPGYENPPLVRVMPMTDFASPAQEFSAYGVPHYGVNVCTGRVWETAETEDTDQIITGAGPGAVFGPHVRGFFVDGSPIPGLSFLAYGTDKFGVNVAAGHTESGYNNAIITGAGPGAVFGPHVRGFRYDQATQTVSPIPEISFFAYGTLKWGVNVACGDIDGDHLDEIITGAGPGAVFGPHVRGWNVDGGPAVPIPGVSFLAYGTNKFGVNVSCGDIDGDGIDEIVTAPGPSNVFGAHIRGWNFDGIALEELRYCSAFAWPPGQALCGANVYAEADMDHDGFNEIIVGGGADPDIGTPVIVLDYSSGEGLFPLCSFDAFSAGFTHGTKVASGTI